MVFSLDDLWLRRAGRIGIWLVLVVLGLGLPRWLVVCSGPHCHGSVELAHARGGCCSGRHELRPVQACCEHGHGAGGACATGLAGLDSGRPSLADGCGSCEDVPLAFVEGPLPERQSHDLGDAVALVGIVVVCTAPMQTGSVVVGPPATGPPRTDPRTALRATTVLLI